MGEGQRPEVRLLQGVGKTYVTSGAGRGAMQLTLALRHNGLLSPGSWGRSWDRWWRGRLVPVPARGTTQVVDILELGSP
ncbi:hypothetical protein E2C01_019240 [Portunus trituberculatus]|uniref:Uncharacterized protein n=1 Tax=Portunus trituberculatus TaxID=210409 RepID=A0A5B7DXC5_PORTR|nr:hypothetical protein [Portunus trituberculatus]